SARSDDCRGSTRPPTAGRNAARARAGARLAGGRARGPAAHGVAVGSVLGTLESRGEHRRLALPDAAGRAASPGAMRPQSSAAKPPVPHSRQTPRLRNQGPAHAPSAAQGHGASQGPPALPAATLAGKLPHRQTTSTALAAVPVPARGHRLLDAAPRR